MADLRRNWKVLYFDGDYASLKRVCIASASPKLAQEDIQELSEKADAEPLPQKTGPGGVLDKFMSVLRDSLAGMAKTQQRPAKRQQASLREYSVCAIEFGRWTVPQREIFYRIDGLTEEDKERFREIEWDIESLDQDPCHQLLGHPAEIQREEAELQMVGQFESHGLDPYETSPHGDPRAGELAKGTADWQLLLQLDSNDRTGMMWDDAGVFYFWIQRQALEARDFDNVWAIVESP